MAEAPTSAMLAIISVIVAAIIFTTFVYVYKSQSSVDTAGQAKIESMNKSNLSDDYLQYAGSTLSGESVRMVLKSSRRETVKIYVKYAENAYAVYEFADGSGKYYLQAADGTKSDEQTVFNTVYQWTANYTKTGWYINPTASYACEVHQGADGVVSEIYFGK